MAAFLRKVFSGPTPEEQVKKWKQNLRGQERVIERQIRGVESEEAKIQKFLRDAAKRNDMNACRMLAREVVHSRFAKQRMYTTKAHLNSISMQLSEQLATAKLVGNLQKSTEVMRLVNSVIKLPAIQATMMDLAKEMTKAGVIEEMIDDAVGALEPEDLDDEADAEVDKIVLEVTNGLLGQAGSVKSHPIAQTSQNAKQLSTKEDQEMLAKLDSLRVAL